MKTNYIEIAWVESECLTYIDPNIEALVGYSSEEVREMPNPMQTLVPNTPIPRRGPANKIIPRTMPICLRHCDGHDVCCEGTFVCLYDGGGRLAEAWGAIRRRPRQKLWNEIEAWWETASDQARRIVHDTALMYPPVSA